MNTYNRVGMALFIVRIALARELIAQGSGILFGAFHGPGVAGFAQFTHLPPVVAIAVGAAQLVGGLAILTGIGARAGAAAAILVLIGALTFARVPSGIATEYALTLLLIAVAIFASGAGRYSLYHLARRQLRKTLQPRLN